MEKSLDPIYRATDVVKRYAIGERTIEILHGLTLTVDPGEFVMLIGPSGCGKSTFMYVLFGLEPPSSGDIFLKSQNLAKLSERQRTELRSRAITMVHQQPIWIKALTVRENVAFPLILQRQSKKKALAVADQLLAVLNLEKLGNNHPNELSVGEQQRCSLMRALITNPEVVFADEPTGSLDTDSSIVVMELFRKMNEQLGKTVIMVTHNLNYLPYGNKIVSMLDGRIVDTKTTRPAAHPKADPTHNFIDILSSWRQEDTSKKPLVTATQPTPPPAGAKPNTTATRLQADIVHAQQHTDHHDVA